MRGLGEGKFRSVTTGEVGNGTIGIDSVASLGRGDIGPFDLGEGISATLNEGLAGSAGSGFFFRELRHNKLVTSNLGEIGIVPFGGVLSRNHDHHKELPCSLLLAMNAGVFGNT
jgi:hypothetical protein